MAVQDEIERGTPVEVLTAYRGTRRPFWLLYPEGVKPPRATRAMIDFIVAQARVER